MAAVVLDMGNNLVLCKGSPFELQEQKINARVMTPEAQARLTENIKKDKRLEQLPFAVMREDGSHDLISGHHRKRSAVAAGLGEIYWLADTRSDMTASTVAAKQVAHNSIQGEDDPETLKLLAEIIDTVDDKLESFLSPADFDSVDQLEATEAVELGIDIDWKIMVLVFTPAILEKLENIERWCSERVPRDTDLAALCSSDILARVRQVMLNVAKVEDVRSLGSVFARMCEIVENHIELEQKVLKALPPPVDSDKLAE